ncbi:MAG: hypothetical protein AAGD13_16420 [Pseudomonadota bacterium]
MPVETRPLIPRFLTSHWRGETPLLRVILINILAIGIALSFVQQGLRGGPETLIVGGAALCCVAVPVWQIVGYVRTYRAHLIEGGDQFLPWAGHLALVSILFVTLSQTIGSILAMDRFQPRVQTMPQSRELAISDRGMIEMRGEIDYETLAALRRALETGTGIKGVDLQSNGGLVYAARAIADVVTTRSLDTHVPEFCNSACTLIFAAGANRSLAEGARLGFHRYGKPTEFHQLLVDADDEFAKDLRFLRDRGVADGFLEKLSAVDNQDMWFPDRSEIEDAGLLTTSPGRRN